MRTHPFARRMRREATLAEQKQPLRLPSGRGEIPSPDAHRAYIVDFISRAEVDHREVDGSQHNEPAGRQRDGARTAYPQSAGLIRVWK